jgi:hypothetical protein
VWLIIREAVQQALDIQQPSRKLCISTEGSDASCGRVAV